MKFYIFHISLIVFDAVAATNFFLRFNDYRLREKKAFIILAPVLVGITLLFENSFDILSIILCIIVSFLFMKILSFDKVVIMRRLWSSVLFYLTLMLNNTLIVSIYQSFRGEDAFLIGTITINYLAMCLSSKLSLLIISRIYIYIAERLENRNKSESIFSLIFISILNIILITVIVNMNMNDSVDTGLVIAMGMAGIFLSGLSSYYMYAKLSVKAQVEMELSLLKQKNELDKKLYQESMSQYDQTRKLNHDIQNHLVHIAYYIEDKQYSKAISYIESTSNHTGVFFDFVNIKNESLRFIINYKAEEARRSDIRLFGNIEDSDHIVLADFDLCTIMGNLLDNAIEASMREKDCHIMVDIYFDKGYQIYSVRNKIARSVIANNKELTSIKKDKKNHGYGMKQIEAITNSYKGFLDIYEKEGYFCVSAILPV